MLRNIWNALRETEWYAVIAMVLRVGALLLAVLIAVKVVEPALWVLAIVLGMSAIVSAIFSHR